MVDYSFLPDGSSRQFIAVTEVAASELKRIATEEGKSACCVKLAMKGGGCSGYMIDMNFVDSVKDLEFDLTFEQNGVVFTIDVKSADLMEGASLDFGGGLLDRGFKWTFPNATGGCGCGTSFSF